MVGRSVGWLNGWFVGCLVDWPHLLVSRWLAGSLMELAGWWLVVWLVRWFVGLVGLVGCLVWLVWLVWLVGLLVG